MTGSWPLISAVRSLGLKLMTSTFIFFSHFEHARFAAAEFATKSPLATRFTDNLSPSLSVLRKREFVGEVASDCEISNPGNVQELHHLIT